MLHPVGGRALILGDRDCPSVAADVESFQDGLGQVPVTVGRQSGDSERPISEIVERAWESNGTKFRLQNVAIEAVHVSYDCLRRCFRMGVAPAKEFVDNRSHQDCGGCRTVSGIDRRTDSRIASDFHNAMSNRIAQSERTKNRDTVLGYERRE